jgi:Protein of unknown function (DUF2971)
MNTLYHYCSSATFAEIISNRNIWLSSLSLSNDSTEGKVMADTFKRIFEKDSLDEDVMSLLRNALKGLESMFDGLGFCLSEAGDLLSQWRGYASDGQGFSIGFSRDYLELLAQQRDPAKSGFTLSQVIYNPADQEAALMPTYNEFKSEVISGDLKVPRFPSLLTGFGDPAAHERYEQEKAQYTRTSKKVFFKMLGSFGNLYRLKNDAFSEEMEWRLVSFLVKGADDHCLFRTSVNRLIPYRVFELRQMDIPAISDVILGPKNTTPESVVEKMLEQYGFPGVVVKRSTATYR